MQRDIRNAENEIVIFSSSLLLSKVKKYYGCLQEAERRGIAVHIILPPSRKIDSESLTFIQGLGAEITYSDHNKHFIIIDRHIIWNCSFDLFGNVPSGAFATRDDSTVASQEVIASVQLSNNKTEPGLFSV